MDNLSLDDHLVLCMSSTIVHVFALQTSSKAFLLLTKGLSHSRSMKVSEALFSDAARCSIIAYFDAAKIFNFCDIVFSND